MKMDLSDGIKQNKNSCREKSRTAVLCCHATILTVVELDDLFLIDVLGQFSTLRQADEFTFYSCFVVLNVCWKMVAVFKSFLNGSQTATSFTQADYIASAYLVRSDIDFCRLQLRDRVLPIDALQRGS